MPSSKGVAIKNCPSLLDFKARTGSPRLSLISKITLGRILPFSSKVMPAIKLGFSGDWGNTKSLAKVAAIAGVVLTGIGSGLNITFGFAAAAGLTTVFATDNGGGSWFSGSRLYSRMQRLRRSAGGQGH